MRTGAALIAAAAALLAPAAAHADLRQGSTHAPLTGKSKRAMRLAMPLPTVTKVPTLQRLKDGRVKVTATVRYRAANWKGAKRVARGTQPAA